MKLRDKFRGQFESPCRTSINFLIDFPKHRHTSLSNLGFSIMIWHFVLLVSLPLHTTEMWSAMPLLSLHCREPMFSSPYVVIASASQFLWRFGSVVTTQTTTRISSIDRKYLPTSAISVIHYFSLFCSTIGCRMVRCGRRCGYDEGGDRDRSSWSQWV